MMGSIREQSCSVMVAPKHHLRHYRQRNCHDMELQPDISYGHFGVYLQLASQESDRAFLHNLTMTLLWLQNQPAYTSLACDMLGLGESCHYDQSEDADASELEQITLQSQIGLFVICGVIAGIAVILALAKRWRGYTRGSDGDKFKAQDELVESYATDGEMLRMLLERVDLLQRHVCEGAHKKDATRFDSSLLHSQQAAEPSATHSEQGSQQFSTLTNVEV